MKIKKIPYYLLSVVNILVAAGMLMTGYSYLLDPRSFGWLALMGYGFPMMLLATIAFLVFWLFVKKRYAIISFLGLLLAYQPATLYCPFTIGSDEVSSDSTITILSYNTHHLSTPSKEEEEAVPFEPDDTDDDKPNSILLYLSESDADIICLQEYSSHSKHAKDKEQYIDSKYEYHDSVRHSSNRNVSWIYSKYPIRRKQLIPYESQGNLSAAFWLDVKGKEVIVINNHLEVTGMSIEDRTKFSEMLHGKQESDTMRTTSRTIVSRLLESSKLRAAQADAVAAFIRQHTTPASTNTQHPSPNHQHPSPTTNHPSPNTQNIIVCGDFNDIPQSYAYHTIAEGLTDCYRECGFGPGYSFSHYAMRVRIDNILCSPTLTPLSCTVDKSIRSSDHYPVIARIKL